MCLEAVQSINVCFSGLYKGDAFLLANEAKFLGETGLRFLRRYSALAKTANDNQMSLFVLLPKLHILQHLMLKDLAIPSETQQYILNPLCLSVQQSEDFIGRNSRLARRVHPTLCARRCLQRHLQLARCKYVEAGYLVETD